MADEHEESQDLSVDGHEADGYPRLRKRYEHYKVGYLRYKRIYLRSLVISVALGVACVALAALLVSALISRNRVEDENAVLIRQIGVLENRLASAEMRFQGVGSPGMVAYRHGSLSPVRDSYVKAIELSEPSLTGTIAFQILLENTHAQDIVPDIILELFDRSGSVLGTHKLNVGKLAVMPAGSANSVSGVFTEPAYARIAFFRVRAN